MPARPVSIAPGPGASLPFLAHLSSSTPTFRSVPLLHSGLWTLGRAWAFDLVFKQVMFWPVSFRGLWAAGDCSFRSRSARTSGRPRFAERVAACFAGLDGTGSLRLPSETTRRAARWVAAGLGTKLTPPVVLRLPSVVTLRTPGDRTRLRSFGERDLLRRGLRGSLP